jgi:hypothetical protein
VPKIPYEMWTDRKPILNYLHVWGCPAEAKLFNSRIGKLDLKSVSCHFSLAIQISRKGSVPIVLIDTSRS